MCRRSTRLTSMPRLPTASLTHVPARAQLTDASGNRLTWHKIAGSVKPRQAPSGLVLAGPGWPWWRGLPPGLPCLLGPAYPRDHRHRHGRFWHGADRWIANGPLLGVGSAVSAQRRPPQSANVNVRRLRRPCLAPPGFLVCPGQRCGREEAVHSAMPALNARHIDVAAPDSVSHPCSVSRAKRRHT